MLAVRVAGPTPLDVDMQVVQIQVVGVYCQAFLHNKSHTCFITIHPWNKLQSFSCKVLVDSVIKHKTESHHEPSRPRPFFPPFGDHIHPSEIQTTTTPSPGPPMIPSFGNIFQLYSNPWEKIDGWRVKYGPVMAIKLGLRTLIILNSREATRDLVDRRQKIYSDRPRMISLMPFILPYSKKWLNIHRLQLRALSPKGAKPQGHYPDSFGQVVHGTDAARHRSHCDGELADGECVINTSSRSQI